MNIFKIKANINQYLFFFSSRVFVRAFYHAEASNDIECFEAKSNEVITTRVDPRMDLLTRPLLKVTSLGVETVILSWKLDDSVDESLVKGFRIFHNTKPTEILPPTQHEYEISNLKPGR